MHIVTDSVTRVMRPKYLLKKSDRYIFVKVMSVSVSVFVYFSFLQLPFGFYLLS